MSMFTIERPPESFQGPDQRLTRFGFISGFVLLHEQQNRKEEKTMVGLCDSDSFV